jgi:hypothetical protein
MTKPTAPKGMSALFFALRSAALCSAFQIT